MIKTLIWENIKKDNAAIVILDPKGDLSRDVAKFVEHTLPHRQDKLVYVSPFDFVGLSPVLNPLQLPPHDKEDYEKLVYLTTQELERTLHNIFSEMHQGQGGFTGLMRSVLSPCIETLIRKGNGDLWDLMRFMDDTINGDLVELGLNSPNEAVRKFFMYSFPTIINETRKGIEWRVRNLLKSPIFAGLTTGDSTIHLKQLINQRKCIIFNLDKGSMGRDISASFGKLIVSLIQVIAMQRGGLPEERKVPIYLYIDEFHNYVTESIKDVLAEARSNKLFLTLAQQLVGQGIPDTDFRRTLMGNTNVKIVGKSTQENYKELTKEFGLSLDEMLKLPEYYFYVKVGNGKAFRLKGRDGLIKGKNSMSDKQWQATIEYQKQKYYTSVADIMSKKRQEEESRQPNKYAETGKKKTTKRSGGKFEKPDEDTLYPF